MAKITLSDLAPSGETVHFTFAGAEFDLGGSAKGTYETKDRLILGEAEVHPWLAVEPDKVEQAIVPQPLVDPVPAEDPNIAFDIEAVRAFEASKARAAFNPVAINADLDQDKKVDTQGVAETLASDTEHDGASNAKNFEGSDAAAEAAAAGDEPPAPRKSSKKSTTTTDEETA